MLYGAVLEIYKNSTGCVPANVLHEKGERLHPCLEGNIPQIENGLFVLWMVLDASEVHMFPAPCSPCLEKLLVYRIELIRIWTLVLQPEPLGHGSLNQRCRGVGVVFEEFWGLFPS